MKKDPIERIARDAKMLKKLHLLGVEMKVVELSGENNTKRIDLITSLGCLISSLEIIVSDLSGNHPVKMTLNPAQKLESGDCEVCNMPMMQSNIHGWVCQNTKCVASI